MLGWGYLLPDQQISAKTEGSASFDLQKAETV